MTEPREPSQERLLRLEMLLGADRLAALTSARVAVIGIGGVGAFCLEALARSGIGAFLLVDMDAVSETSFNRHLLALDESLGQPKVELARARVRSINPAAEVTTSTRFFHEDTFHELVAWRPDLVVDAIDSLTPKVALLRGCLEAGLPVVSATGAARRMDPGRVRWAYLPDVTHDPLSSRIRKRLRRQGLGDRMGEIPVVYSDEPALGLESSEGIADEPGVAGRGRSRVPMGSYCPVVGAAGMYLAHLAMERLVAPRRDAKG